MRDTQNKLKIVKNMLSDKERWIQGTYAINDACHHVFPTDADATQWCLYGAIRKLSKWHEMDDVTDLLLSNLDQDVIDKAKRDDYGALIFFNDNVRHSDVMNLIDKTIETCG